MSKIGSLFQRTHSLVSDRRVPKITFRQCCESQNSCGWEEKEEYSGGKAACLPAGLVMWLKLENEEFSRRTRGERYTNQREPFCTQTQKFETAELCRKEGYFSLLGECVCAETGSRRLG